jgi:hypothetical protein
MRSRSRTLTALATIILVSAGCGAGTASSTSRPTDPGSAGSPAVASADSGQPAASPSTWPTITPLSASWVKPTTDAPIKDYKVGLAATIVGVTSEVTFKIAWSTGSFAGCSSKKPSSAGTWSCTVDLLKTGVPPGKLKASFDVVDASGKAFTNLAPTRTITYAAVPPMPVTTYKIVSQKWNSSGSSDVEVDKVTWTEAAGYATQYRLYGVKGCLNYSAKTNGQPCLVEHMKLPAKNLELIKTASGSTRSMTLKHTITGELCGGTIWCGPFDSLVLRADNAYGQSVFAIVLSEDVCYECVY